MKYIIERINNGFLLYIGEGSLATYYDNIGGVLDCIKNDEKVIEQQRNAF